MNMKTSARNPKRQYVPTGLRAAAAGALALLIAGGSAIEVYTSPCDEHPVLGQNCVALGTAEGGNCSGDCSSCRGTKYQIMYNGCFQCVSAGSSVTNTCTTFEAPCPEKSGCFYKQRVADCRCDNTPPGLCMVSPEDWPEWPNKWSTAPSGNSCMPAVP